MARLFTNFCLVSKKKRIRYAITSPVIQYLLHNYEILQFLNFTVSQLVELNKVDIHILYQLRFLLIFFANIMKVISSIPTKYQYQTPGELWIDSDWLKKNLVWTKKSEIFSKLRRSVERNNIQRGKQCSSGLLWRLGTALIISVIQ